MIRRAVVVVPGYGKREQGAVRDQLCAAFEFHADGFARDFEPDPVELNGFSARRLTATERRPDAPAIRIDVHEAFWGDLIPAELPADPVRKVTRGFALLAYWFFGGVAKGLLRPNYLGAALAASGALLLAWYASLALLAAKALASDPSLAPGWLSGLVGADALSGAVGWVQAQPWWTVLPGLLAGLQADRIAALAEFSKSYLTDAREGDAAAGVRARAKSRVERLLAQIYASPECYDEVFVVGHSMGAAIAIDALADWGADRARTHFHSWGAPMRVFCAQEPEMDAERAKLLAADPPLAGWTDVIARNDWVAGFTPGHREAFGEASSLVVRSPQGWWAGWNASTHEQYFRNPETLTRLIAPVAAPSPQST
ncbi:MAG: hypothetical protein ACFCUS_06400 [Rubrimonas sp.]|uniref:hypothetical protein n=1 Tax=Rubrimonas sp. TaxID=2036015 RepID=UPI002FDDE3C2